MEKKLAKCESMGTLEIVNYFGSKAYVILKKVVNHPLTKPVLCFGGAWFLGNRIMKNGYDATADLGFASFSLTKRT